MSKAYFYGLIMGFVLLCSMTAWYLFNPYDSKAWRVELPAPVLGVVPLRMYPALRLATSPPGRMILSAVSWRSRFGLLSFENKPGLLQVACQPCTFHLPGLSRQQLTLAKLQVSLRLIGRQISGIVRVNDDFRLLYMGSISMQGVTIDWSLPKTRINNLIDIFEGISPVVKQARIQGTLALIGSLNLPGGEWSANPDLQGFSVDGLGTEKLKTANILYRCHSARNWTTAVHNAPYQWLNLSEMGCWLPRAVIIAEDATFKTHPGYNLDALSLILAQRNHPKRHGASTLTQQLAKNFFTGSERTALRKIEELLYSVEMENMLGKRRIFSLYLNTVDWGPGICGAAQAAQVYFNRKPSQLTPVQAAWLASIIRNPHRAWQDQYLNQKPDLKRLNWVMSYMPKKARKNLSEINFGKGESIVEYLFLNKLISSK